MLWFNWPHCSCLSEWRSCIFFPELQCPWTKEINFSPPIPSRHRNGVYRSTKEVTWPVLLAVLTLSNLLIPIMRRPLYPQGKGEEASFPTLFPNKLLQAALSQSLPSVSIHEKVHPGFLGNPTFLVIEIWQRGPWEVATTSAPPPFLFLNFPILSIVIPSRPSPVLLGV